MAYEHLILERDGPVATVTLNRPHQLNALSTALENEMRDAFRALSAEKDLRAIILTGSGRAFSAGVDLAELSSTPADELDRIWHGPDSFAGIARACPHPVIAAVNGFAVTGGLEVALLADFLIASEDAKFADTHARVGITPSWGLTQVLPLLIGRNRAKQMSLTGAFVGAAQALDWGLVNEVVPADQLMPRARELAAEIAETDRTAMTRIRGLIDRHPEVGLTDAYAEELVVFDQHMAGVTADQIGANRAKVQARGKRIAGGGA
ncbi:MAG: enoyl-CoA hydratase [Pseudomonadota bacterium]